MPTLRRIATSDADNSVRKKAVYALGDHDAAGTAEILIGILKSDNATEVRKAALYALGNSDDAKIIPVLKETALAKGMGI
ncbi:MAG: HEAT repeat domain-containing protein [Calditrichae bacterium]|nr:HEAT repeat domain-containing protein [Calditrichia bacterium]